jgi:hypothetical protein
MKKLKVILKKNKFMQEIRISEEFLVKNSGTNQRKLIDEEIIRQKDISYSLNEAI